MSVVGTDHLIALEVDEPDSVFSPDMDEERRVAIFDILEKNLFRLVAQADQHVPSGPYRLKLSRSGQRLVFDVSDHAGAPVTCFYVSQSPFRKIIKDYFAICEAYFDAVKRLGPQQIEAIDIGRRGLHDEGAWLLRKKLDSNVALDTHTARRLFTLVIILNLSI